MFTQFVNRNFQFCKAKSTLDSYPTIRSALAIQQMSCQLAMSVSVKTNNFLILFMNACQFVGHIWECTFFCVCVARKKEKKKKKKRKREKRILLDLDTNKKLWYGHNFFDFYLFYWHLGLEALVVEVMKEKKLYNLLPQQSSFFWWSSTINFQFQC